jgi:hypothetical protein
LCFRFLKLPHTDVLLLTPSFSSKMGMLSKKICTLLKKQKLKLQCDNQMPQKEKVSKIGRGFGKRVGERQAQEIGKRGDGSELSLGLRDLEWEPRRKPRSTETGFQMTVQIQGDWRASHRSTELDQTICCFSGDAQPSSSWLRKRSTGGKRDERRIVLNGLGHSSPSLGKCVCWKPSPPTFLFFVLPTSSSHHPAFQERL